MTGLEHHARTGGTVGARWVYAVLIALIAIAAVAGIVSAAAAGQTQIAIIVGIISLAFFSRIGC